MEKELEKAHQEYEERRERIIAHLKRISSILRSDSNIPDYFSELYSDWLDTAVEFIKEREV